MIMLMKSVLMKMLTMIITMVIFRERPTLPRLPAAPAAQTLSHAIRSFHHDDDNDVDDDSDDDKDKNENDANSDDDTNHNMVIIIISIVKVVPAVNSTFSDYDD